MRCLLPTCHAALAGGRYLCPAHRRAGEVLESALSEGEPPPRVARRLERVAGDADAAAIAAFRLLGWRRLAARAEQASRLSPPPTPTAPAAALEEISMPRAPTSRTCAVHPDRPERAGGLCNSCSGQLRQLDESRGPLPGMCTARRRALALADPVWLARRPYLAQLRAELEGSSLADPPLSAPLAPGEHAWSEADGFCLAPNCYARSPFPSSDLACPVSAALAGQLDETTTATASSDADTDDDESPPHHRYGDGIAPLCAHPGCWASSGSPSDLYRCPVPRALADALDGDTDAPVLVGAPGPVLDADEARVHLSLAPSQSDTEPPRPTVEDLRGRLQARAIQARRQADALDVAAEMLDPATRQRIAEAASERIMDEIALDGELSAGAGRALQARLEEALQGWVADLVAEGGSPPPAGLAEALRPVERVVGRAAK